MDSLLAVINTIVHTPPLEHLQLLASAWQAMLSKPSSRLFWPLLLSPLLLVALITTLRYGKHAAQKQLKQYLSPNTWLHKGTLQDVSWFSLNSLLKPLLVVPLLGSKLAVTIAVSVWLQQNIGDGPFPGLLKQSAVTSAIVIGFFSLLFFTVEDLSRFSLHYAMHKVPWLWKLHKVHHSATAMTPLTIHRLHPLEMCLYHLRSILVFGVLAGLFTWCFRQQVSVWQLLGVDLLGLLFNTFGANLRHSPVHLSFGWLERFFISPAQHQIHHSYAPEHIDKNFGTCFALWDKLAGSWVPAEDTPEQRLSFGLAPSLSKNSPPV